MIKDRLFTYLEEHCRVVAVAKQQKARAPVWAGEADEVHAAKALIGSLSTFTLMIMFTIRCKYRFKFRIMFR